MADFESQLRMELPVLYRVAKRLTRSAEEAEDIVGQTMYAAIKSKHTFDGMHLRSWLIRILRNEFNSTRRKASTRLEVVSEDVEAVSEPIWDQVAWKVDAETLLKELDQLSDEHRLIIQLCDVEEISYDEAADALDIPIGTVRSRLFRARMKLRERCAGKISVEGGTR